MASLSAHAGFLRRHLETDVGGNHLIKNLKALAGLAVFFGDSRQLGHALDRLTSQLAVQVLPDGGHYERAPAYHCQVLADLIDVAELLRSAGQEPGPELVDAIGRMRHWLSCVLAPDGQVPLLNDGYPVSAELIAALRPAAASGRSAAGAARHRPRPGRGGRLAPAGRRRRTLPGGTARPRPRGHAELPGLRGRSPAPG